MRSKINCIVLMIMISGSTLNAQKVGINTTNPQNTLDVRGSIRFGGNTNYMKYDSATGKIEWIGATLFVPALQQIISHSASAEGLYAGGNKLQYRNSGGRPVFFSDWSTGDGYFSGYLGIGTPTPLVRLHVSDGFSGNASPFSPLVVEGANNTYINLLSPDYNETALLFGNNLDAASGGIVYNNMDTYNGLQFRTNGNVTKMVINDNGNVGIGTSTPQASAQLDVSSTTKGFLPPRMSQPQRDLISPVEGLIVYNITTKKPNYYDGRVWKNFDGTCASTILPLTIGDNYQGGKVAYILQPGDPGYYDCEQHGLIAAPSDQSTGIQWYNLSYYITGAIGVAIGTGNANTNTIVAIQGAGSYAAQLCADLTLGGYSDWYLPSKNELNKLYINRVVIGGFASYFYWSSTEYNNASAWRQFYIDGGQDGDYKDQPYYVRAVRAF